MQHENEGGWYSLQGLNLQAVLIKLPPTAGAQIVAFTTACMLALFIMGRLCNACDRPLEAMKSCRSPQGPRLWPLQLQDCLLYSSWTGFAMLVTGPLKQ